MDSLPLRYTFHYEILSQKCSELKKYFLYFALRRCSELLQIAAPF